MQEFLFGKIKKSNNILRTQFLSEFLKTVSNIKLNHMTPKIKYNLFYFLRNKKKYKTCFSYSNFILQR